MHKKSRFSYEFVLGFAFILLIVGSVISYLDPIQKYREYKDTQMERDALRLAKAINSFQDEKGKLPWSDDTGGDNAYPALKWTRVTSPVIGVCNNDSCSEGGDLVKSRDLGNDFLTSGVITSQNLQNTLYIGKGPAKKDNVYVCFLPQSDKARKDLTTLFDIDLEAKTTLPSIQTACSDNVTWREDDLCYKCIVN